MGFLPWPVVISHWALLFVAVYCLGSGRYMQEMINHNRQVLWKILSP